jgi:energy-coupling factor transport system permease protein
MSSEFNVLRNITIGQYIPAESPIHRLDPRAKLLGVLALAMAVSVTRSVFVALLLMVLLGVLTKLAHLEIRYLLRGLLPGLGFLIFLFVMQFLFQGSNVPCSTVWYEWRFFVFSPCLIRLFILGAIRVVAFLFLVSLLTMTTTASHLTHGAEMLLSPFQRIGLPAHEIALANTIALRFIPTLAEELDRIMKAQASRGANIGERRWWRPDLMARERFPLFVPLFLNALRRAEELVVAMEARGYVGSKGRSKYVRFQSRWQDWAAVAFCVLVWLAAWRLPWQQWIDGALGWL